MKNNFFSKSHLTLLLLTLLASYKALADSCESTCSRHSGEIALRCLLACGDEHEKNNFPAGKPSAASSTDRSTIRFIPLVQASQQAFSGSVTQPHSALPAETRPNSNIKGSFLTLPETRWCIYQNVRLQPGESDTSYHANLLREQFRASCANRHYWLYFERKVVNELPSFRTILSQQGSAIF